MVRKTKKTQDQAIHKRPIKYLSDNNFPWEEEQSAKEVGLHESSVKILEKREESKLEHIDEHIFGKDLKWYKEIILWPMFILLVIEVGLRVVQAKYLYLWPTTVFSWTIFLVRAAIFIYLAAVAIKRFKADKSQVITAAIIGGIITGFLLAIFRLFWYIKLWTPFNLIGQTLLFAVTGAIISWLTYLLLNINNKKKL
ncbi:hypothetical protein KKF32_04080 [Patescibacteria group bacterium]|nr:hypothetical protein [Patescibacteria group bacterium]